MPTKTVTIRDEAYNALKAMKMKNESFSDTILRIARQFQDLRKNVGTGTKSDDEYKAELMMIENQREHFFMRGEN
ncbi:MAG: antitoxin VapB family protein [Candidatus Ranarchaeia archaeon]